MSEQDSDPQDDFFLELFEVLETLLASEVKLVREQIDSDKPDILLAVGTAEIVAMTSALLNKLHEFNLDPRKKEYTDEEETRETPRARVKRDDKDMN